MIQNQLSDEDIAELPQWRRKGVIRASQIQSVNVDCNNNRIVHLVGGVVLNIGHSSDTSYFLPGRYILFKPGGFMAVDYEEGLRNKYELME